MNREKYFFSIVIILIAVIFLHGSILNLLANINSLFKKNNTTKLNETYYKEKIEYLEKELSNYELSLNNLKIYEDQNYILSKVAIRNVYDFYNYLILSTDSKVEKNSAVINEDGLVGVVDTGNKNIAKVSLLTGDVSISVKINNSYGQLDDYDKEEKLLIVHNINNYEKIEVGDKVETSGLAKIDANLPIGTVEKIDKKGIEQVIYVKSYADFDNLNYLYCIS